jgi:hypothetical protein
VLCLILLASQLAGSFVLASDPGSVSDKVVQDPRPPDVQVPDCVTLPHRDTKGPRKCTFNS